MRWIDEIAQQPDALRDFARHILLPDKAVNALEEMVRKNQISKVFFTGMGSSLYGCYVASNYLMSRGFFCTCLESFEMLQSITVPVAEDTLIVIVSQSGESPEAVQLAEKIRGKGCVVTVANYPASRLFSLGDIAFEIYAGTEYMTSSKSFSNTLAAMKQIAMIISGDYEQKREDFALDIQAAANEAERLIRDEKKAEIAAGFISDLEGLLCVGGQNCYATASHLELVIEEAGKLYSSRFTPSQFIHGPIEFIRKGFGIIAFEFGDSETLDKLYQAEKTVFECGGKVFRVTNDTDKRFAENEFVYTIKCQNFSLSDILCIIPVELAVYYLATSRGENPGNLMRVVKRMAL